MRTAISFDNFMEPWFNGAFVPSMFDTLHSWCFSSVSASVRPEWL